MTSWLKKLLCFTLVFSLNTFWFAHTQQNLVSAKSPSRSAQAPRKKGERRQNEQVSAALPAELPPHRPNRLIVKRKSSIEPSAVEVNNLHAMLNAQVVRRYPQLGDLEIVEVPPGTSLKETIKSYRQSGLVEYAEPDYIVRATATPNDPLYADGSLWGLHNTGQNAGVADADIDAPEGWDTRTSASGVIVAVIDTGVRYTHEDLAANMWVNSGEVPNNGRDDDDNGYVDDMHGINAVTNSGDPMDDNGHGTHVAGTIGAVGNNGRGVVGAAWQVKLMGLKFLDAQGSGSTSDAIECINYARLKGAHIMNNSWGGGGFSQALFDAIKATRDAGMIFVAAAGNSGEDVDTSSQYPAGYELDNVVSVAATDRKDDLADFSNYGYGVDLAAPGVDITSTWHLSNSDYNTISGTSMATPQVSGALAVLKARFATEDRLRIVNRLYKSTDTVPSMVGKSQLGGRLNLAKALATTSANPRNNSFTYPLKLQGSAVNVSGSNVDASKESGEPNHAANAGGKSVWWSWTSSVTKSVSVSTAGSTFDTLLGVYTGSALNALTAVASNNNDPSGGTTSRVTFNAVAGTTYRFAVDGASGASGGIVLGVTVPPDNNNFSRSITLSGSSPVADGTNVGASKESGEPNHAANAGGKSVWWSWTSPVSARVSMTTEGSGLDTTMGVYTGSAVNALTEVASNDDENHDFEVYTSRVEFNAVAGRTYRIAVDGFDGSTGKIQLSIVSPPPNDNFAGSVTLSGSTATAREFNESATKQSGEPNHAGNAGGHSLWWSWTAPASRRVTITTEDSSFDTLLAVYTGSSVTGLTAVASNDDEDNENYVLTSRVSFNAVAGTTYRIAVDGWNDGFFGAETGSVVLSVAVAPANDNFAQSAVLSGSAPSASGSNAAASKEGGEPNHAEDVGGKSVWWSWTSPASGAATITTMGSNFDTTLGVYTGSSVNALTKVVSNDDEDHFGQIYTSRVSFNAVAGRTYRIAVDGFKNGYSADFGAIALKITSNSSSTGLSSLILNPTSVTGGKSATGTVTLGSPAPSGGTVVTLLSSNTATATVPGSVTVAAGATTATFAVSAKVVASNTTATISASANGVTKTASLTVLPAALSEVTISPSTIVGSCEVSTGRVTLTGPAPSGGVIVNLSDTVAAATVPTSVTVSAGSTSKTFSVNTSGVTSAQSGTLNASYAGATKSATFSVRPIGVGSLTITPNPILGGANATGTVTLECAAAPGGIVVTLTSGNTAVARPTVSSITIPAGQRTGTFTISTTDVSTAGSAKIYARANDRTKSVTLTVNP